MNCHSLQIANVARPAQHFRIADQGETTGCEVRQAGDDLGDLAEPRVFSPPSTDFER